ncbi:hypothetical protein, partial [Salmonella enterica]|uniref:hypothetical protein n=1 Tax=Salmonella enterica TaxID=28901 RepID=UPI0021B2C743
YLHGEHGGVVLVILFLGLIFGVISMSILVISVIRCIFGAYQLLKRVVFRNRDSAFRTDAGTGKKMRNAVRGSTAGRDNAGR